MCQSQYWVLLHELHYLIPTTMLRGFLKLSEVKNPDFETNQSVSRAFDLLPYSVSPDV